MIQRCRLRFLFSNLVKKCVYSSSSAVRNADSDFSFPVHVYTFGHSLFEWSGMKLNQYCDLASEGFTKDRSIIASGKNVKIMKTLHSDLGVVTFVIAKCSPESWKVCGVSLLDDDDVPRVDPINYDEVQSAVTESEGEKILSSAMPFLQQFTEHYNSSLDSFPKETGSILVPKYFSNAVQIVNCPPEAEPRNVRVAVTDRSEADIDVTALDMAGNSVRLPFLRMLDSSHSLTALEVSTYSCWLQLKLAKPTGPAANGCSLQDPFPGFHSVAMLLTKPSNAPIDDDDENYINVSVTPDSQIPAELPNKADSRHWKVSAMVYLD